MMRKPVTLIVFAALLIATFAFTRKTPPPRGKRKAALGTIVVDAGHGGPAKGARGLFSWEADVALAVAMKLGKAIQENFPETKVVYTRTTEDLPGGTQDQRRANRIRAEMANEVKGDLFLSVHCNATRQKAGGWYAKRTIGYTTKTVTVKKKKKTIKVPITESYYVKNERRGTETYIWAADRSSVKSTFINAPEESSEFSHDSTYVAPDMNSPEARIRAQLYEKKYFSRSMLLANYVEDEFLKGGRVSGGVKQRNEEQIWVLQATGMPSILVEIGFITNEEEEKYINSEEGQDQIVQSIINALKRYKELLEGKSTTEE